ncbi:hypothetical protein MKY34_15435 [Sporosarcina sp. FSL K6-1522]|uniref:hypothetical protein n=1 Tax=Sporosarcina sp. FSL K6-1522 TaxID=2921554 RepID=UPI00315AF8A5
MSKCTIDHSLEAVREKLEEQRAFLPADVYENCARFLAVEREQLTLNEVFHLLKKYDLASEEVREQRNAGLRKFV